MSRRAPAPSAYHCCDTTRTLKPKPITYVKFAVSPAGGKKNNSTNQQKKKIMEEENQKKAQKPTANTLQKRYLSLSPRDQLGVTNFFNMHNAAHFIYDGLTEEAQQYVNYCIRLSTKADKIEKDNEKTE